MQNTHEINGWIEAKHSQPAEWNNHTGFGEFVVFWEEISLQRDLVSPAEGYCGNHYKITWIDWGEGVPVEGVLDSFIDSNSEADTIIRIAGVDHFLEVNWFVYDVCELVWEEIGIMCDFYHIYLRLRWLPDGGGGW